MAIKCTRKKFNHFQIEWEVFASVNKANDKFLPIKFLQFFINEIVNFNLENEF